MSKINSNNFIKAVKFIYKNIDEPINLELVASSIGISVSTLKRLFVDVTGSSAGSFIRKIRMERAFRTLKNKEESILEVALSCGFEDHSAFTRSFKETFGYSPSFAKTKISIVNELESISLEEPEIIEIDEFTIQAVTKQGLYFEAAPLAWKELKLQLDEQILNDDFTGTFVGIGHDNPHDGGIEVDQVRFSAGIPHLSNDLNIEKIVIAGGVYAKFNYTGKLNNLGLAYHHIYGAWSNKLSIEIDDKKKAFIMLDRLPNDFKEYSICIYIPLV